MADFIPFPELETRSLLLRRMDYDDTVDLFSMRRDLRMHEYTDTKPDESPDETKAYIDKMNKGIDDGKWIIWAIVHKLSGKVVGTISIWNLDPGRASGELGYGITPEYQGKGLMKEALLKVIEYGFAVMGLKLLEAYTEEENLSSVRLLESCNFLEKDRVDEEGCLSDRIYHMVVYALARP